ncbi:hypothetical protein KBX08_32460 [Micromonospora sp. H61]|uniref:hypothetical protein n=1 Tax=unclassified Micromonospora TaxID=2617518 RepID=UPI001B37FFE3|nr:MULTISPECIES: hypothetical protein [unclassified Micromonospora]MBQ0994774.1 hypothetical protein [Micromonospora sp. H61]MBQ1029184.1 hypothetical protein [Micromonospora sp. C97]
MTSAQPVAVVTEGPVGRASSRVPTGGAGGHIKSRERVRDLGEVYTQPREVQAMLDLIPEAFAGIDSRFLEPACGNGNFLAAILERKIAIITETAHGGTDYWYEFALLRCLVSIYAIDINQQNVHEARHRMREVIDTVVTNRQIEPTVGFGGAVTAILASNIVLGDFLNTAADIIFIEYKPLDGERFARIPSPLEAPDMDLFYVPPEPLATVHYSQLGVQKA